MPPVTKPQDPKSKRRRQLMYLGAAGGVLLLYMLMRSRKSAGSTAADPNAASNAAAQQAAADQQAAQQAALAQGAATAGQAPSSFSDPNAGAYGGAFGSPTQAPMAPSTSDSHNVTGDTVSTSTVNNVSTTNNVGQPAGGQQAAAKAGVQKGWTGPVATMPRLPTGAMFAPFGHNRPSAKPGYNVKGLGNGYWAYVRK